MATVEAYKASYYNKFSFLVVINGFVRAGFQKVSGLEQSVEVIEYNEGGHLRPHKSPGKAKSNDITLERGETDDMDLYKHWKKVYDHATESGGVIDKDYKMDIQILQVDRKGTTKRKWNIYGTWPSSFGVDDWDATSNEKHIEKITLVNDGFVPVTL